MPGNNVPCYGVLSVSDSGWKVGRHSPSITSYSITKTLTTEVSRVGRVRLLGWESRDAPTQCLETLGNLAQCQSLAFSYPKRFCFCAVFYRMICWVFLYLLGTGGQQPNRTRLVVVQSELRSNNILLILSIRLCVYIYHANEVDFSLLSTGSLRAGSGYIKWYDLIPQLLALLCFHSTVR